MYASSPVCNGFLRFTFLVTPALKASMGSKPFRPLYLHMCVEALVLLEPIIECAVLCVHSYNFLLVTFLGLADQVALVERVLQLIL